MSGTPITRTGASPEEPNRERVPGPSTQQPGHPDQLAETMQPPPGGPLGPADPLSLALRWRRRRCPSASATAPCAPGASPAWTARRPGDEVRRRSGPAARLDALRDVDDADDS